MSELIKLKTKLNKINADAKAECNLLMRGYAISRAKFKVGDILQGTTFTVLVTSIKWGATRGYTSSEINPYAAYYGKILTKKLLPRKDGDTATLYGYDELIKLENKQG